MNMYHEWMIKIMSTKTEKKKTENNKKGRKKVKFSTFHPKKNRPGVNSTKRGDSTRPYYLTA